MYEPLESRRVASLSSPRHGSRTWTRPEPGPDLVACACSTCSSLFPLCGFPSGLPGLSSRLRRGDERARSLSLAAKITLGRSPPVFFPSFLPKNKNNPNTKNERRNHSSETSRSLLFQDAFAASPRVSRFAPSCAIRGRRCSTAGNATPLVECFRCAGNQCLVRLHR